MAGACLSPEADLGLVASLLGSVDCNVRTMAEVGYGALSRPGSPIAEALTIMLTLYVAFIGLRLMMGRGSLQIGELTMTVLKVGVVLALATNWPTYQQVVFDTLIKGPEQLGAAFLGGLRPAGDGALASSPFAGLQVAYDQLQAGALYFNQRSTPSMSPLQGGPGFAAFALNVSGLVLLLTTLGSLLAAKIVLALLLGLGPIFIAFLLFDATRGLFEGWLRAAIGFAVVPLLAVLSLVVQLTLIEPQLIQMAELQARKSLDLGPASAIFVLSLIFMLVNTALLIAGGVIATSFRLPTPRRADAPVQTNVQPQAAVTMTAAGARDAGRQGLDRVAHIASSAAAMERRDGRNSVGAAANHRLVVTTTGLGARSETPRTAQRNSSPDRRSAQPRRAASSLRRDK